MAKLGISKTYLKFFVENNKERWVILQGGRRSGKSFAVHKWLHFKASGLPKTIGIIAASFPALQLAMNDFQRATGLVISGNTMLGYSCILSNGSRFLFRSFDEPTKVQGSTFDIVYLEEALNIPEQVISVLSMSVTEQLIAAYNPTKTSVLDKYIAEDRHNYLKTTFKDNPFLSAAQIEEFEFIKQKALSPTASIIDRYNYRVYYLGDFGSMSGKVFKMVNTIPDVEFDLIDAVPIYALDFGFIEQADFTTCIAVKIWNNCVYAKELIYDNGSMQNDKNLAYRLRDLGIDEYTQCVGDYGGLGKTRIHNLVTAQDASWDDPIIDKGFSIANARKGKIIDGITTILNFDKIFVTESSKCLRNEMDSYELDENGKPKGKDHAIDALRYGVMSYDLVNWY